MIDAILDAIKEVLYISILLSVAIIAGKMALVILGIIVW